MKSYTTVLRLFVLFTLCLMKLGCSAQILNLHEGDICPNGDGKDSSNYICQELGSCITAKQGIKNNVRPKICSFKGSIPVVCCPPTLNVQTTPESIIETKKPRSNVSVKARSAAEMCHEYSELIYTRINDPVLLKSDSFITVKDCTDVKTLIVGGTKAEPKEFPHMALLGYGEKVDNKRWACGGSLISDKWILTAAHCEKIERLGFPDYARWARLGDLNYLIDTDLAEPKDYKIVQRIIHPQYQPPSLYNDIALFRLEKSVEFSSFIRPVCLNTDQFFKTSTLVATGWGQTRFRGSASPDLLKVTLNTVPNESCNTSFAGNVGLQLPNGIVNSMLCAGDSEGGKDACGGDSGGPIQTLNPNYTCMYTQMGITSFGKSCGEKNSPGVYTKVSNYISWIEPIVWPKI